MTSLVTLFLVLFANLVVGQENQLVNVDDFHITNPLFGNNSKEIHGWEIDGLV